MNIKIISENQIEYFNVALQLDPGLSSVKDCYNEHIRYTLFFAQYQDSECEENLLPGSIISNMKACPGAYTHV